MSGVGQSLLTGFRDARPAFPVRTRPLPGRFGSFLSRFRRLVLRHAPGGRMLNANGILALGNRYLKAARRSAGPVSLAVFEFAHLQEAGRIFGDSIRHALLAQVRRQLTAAAGPHGAVARTGPGQFTVLWLGSDRQMALDAIHREMGTPACVELESDHDEIVLVPEFEVERAEGAGESIQELHRELCRELQEVLQLQQRYLTRLTREHKRHSCFA